MIYTTNCNPNRDFKSNSLVGNNNCQEEQIIEQKYGNVKREDNNCLFIYHDSILVQAIVKNFVNAAVHTKPESIEEQELCIGAFRGLSIPVEIFAQWYSFLDKQHLTSQSKSQFKSQCEIILESYRDKTLDPWESLKLFSDRLAIYFPPESNKILSEGDALREIQRVFELEKEDTPEGLDFFELLKFWHCDERKWDFLIGKEYKRRKERLIKSGLENNKNKSQKKEEKPKPKTERLIELGLEIGEYFKGADGENYCSIGTETFKVTSSAFKTILYQAFYERYSEGLTSEAWSNGRVVLEAYCKDGVTIPVYLRTAYKNSSVTVDLGQQYIDIDKDGWRVKETTSLKFLRAASSQDLNVPTLKIQDLQVALDRLRKLINLPPESLRLLLAWMTFSFIEGLSKPLLCFTGTHGVGKSTVSRLVKDLLDPDSLGLGTTPNDSRSLAIACQKRWILAFDNSSGFSNEISDALCRIVTGAGFSARTLYSDGEETIFSFKRPVLLNGIGDFINRPDLLDRSMILELDPLEERLSERQLQKAIEEIKPDLLGFLFTSIFKALPIFEASDDRQYNLPRMADFGLWLVSLEKVWDLPEGLLLNTFNGNQSRSSEVALETSPTALAIFKLFEDGRTYWDGTTQKLLDHFLTSEIFATSVKAKDFPKTVHALRTALTRLTPDLAKQGFEIKRVRVGKEGTRKIIIRKLNKIEIINSASSVSSAAESQTLEASQREDCQADDLADDKLTIPVQNKVSSVNQNKKADDALTADDRLTMPKNTIVSHERQSEQALQKLADDADDPQAKLSMSVKLKDGTLAKVGNQVRLPDKSIATIIQIDSEESIKLESYSNSFSAFSLETAN